jgi:hypothetical protein
MDCSTSANFPIITLDDIKIAGAVLPVPDKKISNTVVALKK